MNKLVKVIASLVIAVSFLGMFVQVVNAKRATPRLASAEFFEDNPAIRKGHKIMVIIKDTKKQTVPVYKNNGRRARGSVKMGSRFTAKAIKKARGKKIVKVTRTKWLNTKDVTED